MKNIVKWCGIAGVLAWFIVFVTVLSVLITKNTNYTLIGLVISLVFIFASCLTISFSYKESLWFLKYDELVKLIEENNASWRKAEKLIRILGECESIKLWNKEKENKVVKE